jgi:hypothetical protein
MTLIAFGIKLLQLASLDLILSNNFNFLSCYNRAGRPLEWGRRKDPNGLRSPSSRNLRKRGATFKSHVGTVRTWFGGVPQESGATSWVRWLVESRSAPNAPKPSKNSFRILIRQKENRKHKNGRCKIWMRLQLLSCKAPPKSRALSKLPLESKISLK